MAILFVSCYKSEKYENSSSFSFKDFNITVTLNATIIEFDEPIMQPLLFVKSDSLLIVQNIRTSKMLYVYNVNTRKKVGEFISWGSGPEDLLRIKNIQLVDSNLYIADNQKRSMYIYDISDFRKSTNNPIPIQKTVIDDFFSNLAYTGNGYVATTMNPNDKRLVFYDLMGEREFSSGEYPYFGKDFSEIEKIEGFLSTIAVSHKHKRIYLFGMNTDLIEIYDFQGKLIKRVHGPDQVFPQTHEINLQNGAYKVSTGKSKFTFYSPTIIDDEIYVSYSGKLQKIGEEFPLIQKIFIFDMDCNPIRNYELSKPIVSFTVDPETKQIFATSNVPEYHLVVFE